MCLHQSFHFTIFISMEIVHLLPSLLLANWSSQILSHQFYIFYTHYTVVYHSFLLIRSANTLKQYNEERLKDKKFYWKTPTTKRSEIRLLASKSFYLVLNIEYFTPHDIWIQKEISSSSIPKIYNDKFINTTSIIAEIATFITFERFENPIMEIEVFKQERI